MKQDFYMHHRKALSSSLIWLISPDLPLIHSNPPASVSQSAGITSMYRHILYYFHYFFFYIILHHFYSAAENLIWQNYKSYVPKETEFSKVQVWAVSKEIFQCLILAIWEQNERWLEQGLFRQNFTQNWKAMVAMCRVIQGICYANPEGKSGERPLDKAWQESQVKLISLGSRWFF